jgi:hypothetical protein
MGNLNDKVVGGKNSYSIYKSNRNSDGVTKTEFKIIKIDESKQAQSVYINNNPGIYITVNRAAALDLWFFI